jgi:hypothetical protein
MLIRYQRKRYVKSHTSNIINWTGKLLHLNKRLVYVLISDSIMIQVTEKTLEGLPEKDRFYAELQKSGLTLEDIPQNLYSFHEALKNTFGKHHFSVESQIIKFLHECTKQGIYKEKDASKAVIQLIDVFTKEHKKEIAATKEALNQKLLLERTKGIC